MNTDDAGFGDANGELEMRFAAGCGFARARALVFQGAVQGGRVAVAEQDVEVGKRGGHIAAVAVGKGEPFAGDADAFDFGRGNVDDGGSVGGQPAVEE